MKTIITFETASNDIVYLDLNHVVCIIDDRIVTTANAWSIQVCKEDLDKVIQLYKQAMGFLTSNSD